MGCGLQRTGTVVIDWHPYSHGKQRGATVWLAVIAVLIAYAFGAASNALHFTPPWWLDTPAVFGFYGILYAVYERRGWRWPRLYRAHGIPDLSGEYIVKIRSSHDGHVTVHTGKAVISQSWSRISVRLETDNSCSKSNGAWLVEVPGTGFRLAYTYANTPKSTAAPVLAPHEGTAVIIFKTDRHGSGEYYNGRGRSHHGEITFEPKSP